MLKFNLKLTEKSNLNSYLNLTKSSPGKKKQLKLYMEWEYAITWAVNLFAVKH
jgi:hypothetical protein